MSRGRPATLDASLLARKGNAIPAISDESPLILNLEEHRAEVAGQVADSDEDKSAGNHGTAEAAGRDGRPKLSWFSRISLRARWMLLFVAAALVLVVWWLSGTSSEVISTRADGASNARPVAASDSGGLQLNLTAPTDEAPQSVDRVEPLAPSGSSVALPAAVALAATVSPNDDLALARLDIAANTATPELAPPARSLIPVNVPSDEDTQSFGGVDSAPDIPATVPKSVSPVPIPKAKPELAVVPAGAYAVQLASIATEKRATDEAFRLQKRLGRILGGHEIRVEKAVVAGKGTMFRLRAGGFKSNTEARAVCRQIVQLKLDCLALRR